MVQTDNETAIKEMLEMCIRDRGRPVPKINGSRGRWI